MTTVSPEGSTRVPASRIAHHAEQIRNAAVAVREADKLDAGFFRLLEERVEAATSEVWTIHWTEWRGTPPARHLAPMLRRLLPGHAGPLALTLLAACAEPDGHVFGTDELATEPTLFAPGVVSTDQEEYRIAFSADGREAYFTRSPGGRRGRPVIMVTRVVAGRWSAPEPASFSTGWEEAPFLTPDGRRLIYASRRDVPGWGPVPANSNLWMVERGIDGVWSEPSPLPGEVNRPRVEQRGTPGRSETGAVLLRDGTLLYSSDEEPERQEDIYIADQVEGRFVNVRPMLLDTSGDEAGPAMSPDGRFLVFHGFRDVYAPGDDLFLSERTEYGWSTPRPLPEPINTRDDERWASFSPDGRLLFFSSDRGPGGMSIYYVSAEAAGLRMTQER